MTCNNHNSCNRTPSAWNSKMKRKKIAWTPCTEKRASSGRSKNRYGYTEERLREVLLYVDIRTYRTAGGCRCACRKSWAWRWLTSTPCRTCLIKQKCRLYLTRTGGGGWIKKTDADDDNDDQGASLPRDQKTRKEEDGGVNPVVVIRLALYVTNVETLLFPRTYRDISTNSGI